jgi:hypothetical protein
MHVLKFFLLYALLNVSDIHMCYIYYILVWHVSLAWVWNMTLEIEFNCEKTISINENNSKFNIYPILCFKNSKWPSLNPIRWELSKNIKSVPKFPYNL